MVNDMKKIIVIGCPGSGKSTFSRALNAFLKIPLYHLDMLYWNKDKTTVGREVFTARLKEILQREEWIIDGNYSSTMEMRMQECDTVIFLDYPTDVCLSGIKERCGKMRSDMPWVETAADEEFIEFVKKYNEQQRPQVLELIKKYGCKNIIVFESRAQADEFLQKLEE